MCGEDSYLGQVSNLQVKANDEDVPGHPHDQPCCILQGRGRGGEEDEEEEKGGGEGEEEEEEETRRKRKGGMKRRRTRRKIKKSMRGRRMKP